MAEVHHPATPRPATPRPATPHPAAQTMADIGGLFIDTTHVGVPRDGSLSPNDSGQCLWLHSFEWLTGMDGRRLVFVFLLLDFGRGTFRFSFPE